MAQKNPARYTITAALPYTNGPIHIGHLAGVYVPADIYSRYLKGRGEEVLFVCGSDEHGVAISMKAKKEGVSPQEIIDKYDAIISKSFQDFGIQFDNYSRTSAAVHHETASEFFKKLYEEGKFTEEVSDQLYDDEAQQFLADRYVIGTCPKCGHEEAYGDQCEKCGTSLSATDLIHPKSTITGSIPTLKETKHWYLPLDQYEDFLKDWILVGHKSDWKPNVYGQCKSWIDDGLRPRAVTRDLDWGIPVPVPGGEGKVLYVWFDAPIGYISSSKEWAKNTGKDWEPFWKAKDTKLVHFIGKDNIVFHCIIFPSMLKAHGGYILPENVPANEFLNLEGQKLSTSKNWAVWLHEYLEEFPEQQDVLRYTLTANAPESKDNDFTWKDFQARNNNELLAIFGNFINRVVVLTHKYYEGKVPSKRTLNEIDLSVLAELKAFPETIASSIERYRFREASQELMNLARLGNKYLADEEPWKLIKTDPKRVETVMNIALQIATSLAVVSEPLLPFTSSKLKNILGLNPLSLTWESISKSEELIHANHTINPAELLFRRIEDEEIQKQIDKLEATKKENLPMENNTNSPKEKELENTTNPKTNLPMESELEAVKEHCTYDDFLKLDLRTATIIEAEKMPKADKLLVFKVDMGFEIRTIVSGIAEHFTPEELIGKRVTVVANLAPRKLRGVESQGMILLTENTSGKLVFVNPDEENVPNGKTIN